MWGRKSSQEVLFQGETLIAGWQELSFIGTTSFTYLLYINFHDFKAQRESDDGKEKGAGRSLRAPAAMRTLPYRRLGLISNIENHFDRV